MKYVQLSQLVFALMLLLQCVEYCILFFLEHPLSTVMFDFTSVKLNMLQEYLIICRVDYSRH